MKKFLVFGVILIITLVVGVSLKNKKPDYAPLSQETTQSQQDIPRSDTSKSDTSKLDNLPLMDSNQYLDYSPQNLSLSQKKGRTILFFKADWCSTCNALNKELLSESAVLPEDVTILKINYDTADDLKKKYQVTVQHTLIEIDQNGDVVNRWVGGGLKTLNQQLQ